MCVSAVILHDYYDFPFNDVLDWNNFSVILKEEHVPDLEKILKGIPEENYKKMHQNLLQVDKNFVPFQSNQCIPENIHSSPRLLTKYFILVCRLGSTSNGILFLSSMICFAWLCMSYGCAATSLSIELLEEVSTCTLHMVWYHCVILNSKHLNIFPRLLVSEVKST